ncbi:DUF2269 family protein [Mesorhizobium sp. WSM4904]|nr:DUF2269 family protein [Mesorhizobium sp. WSM4904]WFP64420.1 DUF2269 family protein [Mesorhizobium sp. WSM4904]
MSVFRDIVPKHAPRKTRAPLDGRAKPMPSQIKKDIQERIMDWYSIVKFLHVVSAILWVGGGFVLFLLGMLAERAGNTEDKLQAMRASGELGGRFFAPMSMLTLIFGLVMCGFWVGFSDLWIIIGLAGYATTFSIGMLVFKPTGERMGAMVAREGVTPAVLAIGQRMMSWARFDYAVMLVIIADMVLKPTLHDIGILAGMAVVVAAGAALALGGSRQLVPSAA